MNTKTHSGAPRPFDAAAREREWQAQEQALREERLGLAPGDDARVSRYRVLARALREPLQGTLQADFASRISLQVEARSPVNRRSDVEPFTDAFERNLLRVLIAFFGLAIGIATALYGGESFEPVADAVLRAGATLKNPWLLAFTACLVLSGGLQRVQRHQR